MIPWGEGTIRECVVSENVGIHLEVASFAEGFDTSIEEMNAAIAQPTALRITPSPMKVVGAEGKSNELRTDALSPLNSVQSTVTCSTTSLNRTMIDGMIALRVNGCDWHNTVATIVNWMVGYRLYIDGCSFIVFPCHRR